jgi:hypothetical protein
MADWCLFESVIQGMSSSHYILYTQLLTESNWLKLKIKRGRVDVEVTKLIVYFFFLLVQIVYYYRRIILNYFVNVPLYFKLALLTSMRSFF